MSSQAYAPGKTTVEKILSQHSSCDARAGDIVIAPVDIMMATDTTAPMTIQAFENMGGNFVVNPDKVFFVIDHAAPPPNETIANLHAMMRLFAQKQGIRLYESGEGICHQLLAESELIRRGDIVLGADSHTCTYGALGALATGVGATDLAAAMLTGKSWFKVPESIKIILTGSLQKGVYAKDLILTLIGKLKADGAVYQCVEFHGGALEKFSLAERMTVANMVSEMGGKTCFVFPQQDVFSPDADARYTKVLELDLSKLTPMLSCPHEVDNVFSIDDCLGQHIDQVVLGSCTNGRLEDLELAARILNGKRVAEGLRLYVFPASRKVLLDAIKAGAIDVLIRSGALIFPPGCGVCVGTHAGIPGDGEVVLSTSNRNFCGRMGNNKAQIYLSSPATAACSAISGRITDPRSSELHLSGR